MYALTQKRSVPLIYKGEDDAVIRGIGETGGVRQIWMFRGLTGTAHPTKKPRISGVYVIMQCIIFRSILLSTRRVPV